MRFFTCLMASSLSFFVVGAVSPSPITVVVTQGGALAILGWAFWYLLSKHLPEERKIFLDAQERTRTDYMDSNKKMSEAINKLTDVISEL